MNDTERGLHSAAAPMLGYFYQVRYALFESLHRLRRGQEFIVEIETLDDIVFEENGEPPELLQTKHHLNNTPDLTDSSPDLWKTFRIWCDALRTGDVPDGTCYFLITTARAAENSAAHYLKQGKSRKPEIAKQRLIAVVNTSRSQENEHAYESFQSLSSGQQLDLLSNTFVLDATATISDLDEKLKREVYGFTDKKFYESFLKQLEGWWFRRTIPHLIDEAAKPILSEEIEAELAYLREQFKEDNLPIYDEIMSASRDEIMGASIDASGNQDRFFVHQLRLIEIGNGRIFHAIRNLFRAFEHRSRWIREDLLHVGKFEQYEDRLFEEWDIHFNQMLDELGADATEEAKKAAAQALYKWVETDKHLPIRWEVTEPSISRGTYQLLSDSQRVGWHAEFREKLHHILEVRETLS